MTEISQEQGDTKVSASTKGPYEQFILLSVNIRKALLVGTNLNELKGVTASHSNRPRKNLALPSNLLYKTVSHCRILYLMPFMRAASGSIGSESRYHSHNVNISFHFREAVRHSSSEWNSALLSDLLFRGLPPLFLNYCVDICLFPQPV